MSILAHSSTDIVVARSFDDEHEVPAWFGPLRDIRQRVRDRRAAAADTGSGAGAGSGAAADEPDGTAQDQAK
jgi:hypothetical protein